MAQFEGRSVDDPVPPSSQAPKLYWLAVILCGLIGVLVIVGAILLAWQGQEVPEGILVMGASAVTALAVLLRPSGE
jgi:uncharacterized membrane protein YhaH (DUF805 family)